MIRLLRLQNFKCFEDQSLDFRPLTLLTGLNGTGKSSVLQSLLLLRQSYQEGLLTARGSLGIFEKVGLMLKGGLINVGTGADALFEGAKEEVIGFELASEKEIEEGKIQRWRFSCNREADVLDGIFPFPFLPNLYHGNLFGDNFHYLQAERIGPRLFYETSDFLVRKHRQLGSRGEYTAHFLLTFGQNAIPNSDLSHPEAISSTLQHQVEAWLGEISPGARISLTPNLSMDTVSLQYSFVMGKQVSNNYRATNVGFGLTYTLPVIVAVLSSVPDSLLVPGSLLLIENPEAHLHPKGQAMMGDLLARAASCGIQVVVETHSDHVLNGIRVAVHDGRLNPNDVMLHFFQRREQDGQLQVVSPQIDRDGRLDQWPDGFFDEWDKSLEALLQPRKE